MKKPNINSKIRAGSLVLVKGITDTGFLVTEVQPEKLVVTDGIDQRTISRNEVVFFISDWKDFIDKEAQDKS